MWEETEQLEGTHHGQNPSLESSSVNGWISILCASVLFLKRDL